MYEEVIKQIEASISDNFLSKAEKQRIKHLLEEENISLHSQNVLRSELFKLAHEKINDQNFHEIIDWLEKMNKLILSVNNTEKINERVYFSPGEDCLNAIVQHVRSSKQVIKICLFTISDNRISEALLEKQKQGVKIKVITDNDKVFDEGSDISHLFEKGIPVKVDVTSNHMHHKFALFDRKTTITGSYNWTRSAAQYNHENLLVTDSKVVHDAYEKEFIQLWDELEFFDQL